MKPTKIKSEKRVKEIWKSKLFEFNMDHLQKRFSEISISIPLGYKVNKKDIRIEDGRVVIKLFEKILAKKSK